MSRGGGFHSAAARTDQLFLWGDGFGVGPWGLMRGQWVALAWVAFKADNPALISRLSALNLRAFSVDCLPGQQP